MTDTGSALLTAKEAAHYLGGVSVRTMDRLAERGELTKVKVKRSTRYKRSELDAYLASHERRVA